MSVLSKKSAILISSVPWRPCVVAMLWLDNRRRLIIVSASASSFRALLALAVRQIDHCEGRKSVGTGTATSVNCSENIE